MRRRHHGYLSMKCPLNKSRPKSRGSNWQLCDCFPITHSNIVLNLVSYITFSTQFDYSRVSNNRRGWNNGGRGGRLDIVIIINNGGVGIIRGVGRGWKNNVGGFSVLKLNTTLFSFFLTNGHIFPIQFDTRKLRNDGI